MKNVIAATAKMSKIATKIIFFCHVVRYVLLFFQLKHQTVFNFGGQGSVAL